MRLVGLFPDRTVTIDGVSLDPRPSQRVWNHSPDGFNWGYGGSGPAQFALAILLHAGLDRDTAVHVHQALKWDFVARLPQASFDVEFDLRAWIERTME
jgi:hypothetical protein